MKLKLNRMKGASVGVLLSVLSVAGCASYPDAPKLNQIGKAATPAYLIGPGDTLQVFVFNNPDLSTTIPVRPDGHITLPLVPNLPVSGMTATEVAAKIQDALSDYVKSPTVSVMVVGFKGPIDQQIRVVGAAVKPQTFPYVEGMTVLDVMIQSGGLTQFADGNHAILLRKVNGKQVKYRVRLDDLMNHGDMSANAAILPGDILVVPQSWF